MEIEDCRKPVELMKEIGDVIEYIIEDRSRFLMRIKDIIGNPPHKEMYLDLATGRTFEPSPNFIVKRVKAKLIIED